jgi:hypothetical protein
LVAINALSWQFSDVGTVQRLFSVIFKTLIAANVRFSDIVDVGCDQCPLLWIPGRWSRPMSFSHNFQTSVEANVCFCGFLDIGREQRLFFRIPGRWSEPPARWSEPMSRKWGKMTLVPANVGDLGFFERWSRSTSTFSFFKTLAAANVFFRRSTPK